MAFDVKKPADNQTIAAGPAEIRENMRALKDDKIVNAQKVMDLNPGNASGNIPVANGNLCVNLNAEKLGGSLASAFATANHTHGAVTTSSNGLMSNTDKAKLDGIAAGAEVNQNAFSNIRVGTTTIAADGKTDSLELAAGTNIMLTPDATNDRVTVAVTGTVASADTVDGKHANDFTQNFVVENGVDLNTLTTSGIYRLSDTPGNGPSGVSLAWSQMLVLRGNNYNASIAQIAVQYYSGRTFIRSGNPPEIGGAGQWTAWRELAVVDGNIATATKLQTARTINGVPFDGSANITVTAAANGGTSAACSGNAATASKLVTARTISLNGTVTGSGTFDGTANLSIATSGGVPSGMIAYYPSSTPPVGWLECNGAAVSRTKYTDLFAVIGTAYGTGDGSTTFNLPDLRGEFVRGWDHGRGVDASRSFGSLQLDQFKTHSHSIKVYSGSNKELDNAAVSANYYYNSSSSALTYSTGGEETRPRNIALLPCIKY